jgi:hypothetical protein
MHFIVLYHCTTSLVPSLKSVSLLVQYWPCIGLIPHARSLSTYPKYSPFQNYFWVRPGENSVSVEVLLHTEAWYVTRYEGVSKNFQTKLINK